MTPRAYSERPLGDLDRAAFYCGVPPLDDYFCGEQITREVGLGLTAAFVFVDSGASVAGYYTLSNYQVIRDDLSGALRRKMPYSNVPATLIGRLAVQKALQGQGVGSRLLMSALIRAHKASGETGSRVCVVDTIDDDARRFYVRRGFQKLSNEREQYFFDLRRVPEFVAKLTPS